MFPLQLLPALGARVWAVLGAVAAVLGVLLGVYRAGRRAERVDSLRTSLSNAETRHEIEDDLRRGGAGAAAERLRGEWSRD